MIIVKVLTTLFIIVCILYGYLQEKELELTHKEENESRNKA